MKTIALGGHEVNATFKTIMLWMSLLVVIFLAWHFAQIQKKETSLKFSEFMTKVEAGQVNEVTDHRATRSRARRPAASPSGPTRRMGYEKYIDTLLAKKVNVNIERDQTPAWANMLISWAPFLLLIGFWVFFMRQMQSGGNKALSFGKSKAKLLGQPAEEGHVQGRGRRRRGQGGAAGDHRVPARAPEVPEARRPHPQGRAADGPPGHGQDAAGARHRGRGQRAVLLHLGLGLRRDVRGRGRLAACATCSSRARRTRPASSSSTRSTPWAATAAPAWAAATTSASRRSTSSWSRWTASRATTASS